MKTGFYDQAAASLRFGWRTNTISNYQIFLADKDIADPSTLSTSDTFVQSIADRMVGEADDTPRCVVIPNAREILGSTEKVQQFQNTLMNQLATVLRKTHPELFVEINPCLTQEQNSARISSFEVESENDDPYKRHNRGGFSHSFVHWDYFYWPIIAAHYGRFKNIIGGLPRLIDVRQMARDQGKKVIDLIEPALLGKTWFTLDDQHCTPKNLERYVLQIDPSTEPIIIWNNTLEGGVAHGPTMSTAADPNAPGSRPMYHTHVELIPE